jgi:outer membrane protein OmpA-like peptidoglycan-associated protein
MKTNTAAMFIGGAALMGGFACATATPSPELLSARAAYQTAESGPAKEMNPADLHDAKVLLDQAESAVSSPDARHRAYLAQRRAELADAQGKTSAAISEKAQTQQQMQAIKDKSLATAKGQLAQASATQAQTQTELSQTQRQLDAEHQSRVEMHGQLAEASATQQRTQTQLTQAQDQFDAEHQARLVAEQNTLDALGKIAAVRQEARGMVITLSGSVLFASGKSELLSSAQHRLDQVAEALRTNDRTILIEGHTDSRGSDAFNQQLGQSRAQSVLDYLVSRGVQRERVRAVGLGSSRPIAENSTAEGRANNRRVEIVLEARQPTSRN